jgi:hypothetical protein
LRGGLSDAEAYRLIVPRRTLAHRIALHQALSKEESDSISTESVDVNGWRIEKSRNAGRVASFQTHGPVARTVRDRARHMERTDQSGGRR